MTTITAEHRNSIVQLQHTPELCERATNAMNAANEKIQQLLLEVGQFTDNCFGLLDKTESLLQVSKDFALTRGIERSQAL